MRYKTRLPDFVLSDIDALKEWDHVHALEVYATCLRNAGWNGRTIARAFGRNVNWAYDHYIDDPDVDRSLREYRLITGLGLTVPPIPERPKVVKVDRRKRRKRASPETLERLMELRPVALNYRGTAKNRDAAQEYVRLLNYAITVEGVSTYSLAIDLGVTHHAIDTRLVRYGYRTSKGQSPTYQPLKGRSGSSSRVGKKWTYCKRGHPLTGDNVRSNGRDKNGNPMRTCRICGKERSRRNHMSKRAAQAATSSGGES